MDGPGGIRVYSLPVERIQVQQQEHELQIDSDVVVDDWEQLAENSSPPPETEIFIPDCTDLNFDLLKGYIPMEDGGNHVGFAGRTRDRTACMRWMIKHYQKLKSRDETRLFDVDFMTGNGVIRRIMTSQFSNQSKDGHLAVILLKGTYYIWDVTNGDNDNDLNNKRSFAGLRFEDFVSRGLDGKENEPSNGDQNNYVDCIKYYNIVRFKFDIFEMLVAGEVDCVLPGSNAAEGKKPKVNDFIEIKTSASLEDKYNESHMSHIFRCDKTTSWFAQCILMGVKHIVVGIREEDGDKMSCKKTHAFTVEELRRHSSGSWSKNRCFDSLKKFLYMVKEKVTEENAEVFSIFTVNGGIISEPVKKTISDDESLPNISEVVGLFNEL